MGHFRMGKTESVVFGPSLAVDYELEFAAIIGKPVPMGQSVDAVAAEDHIFGFVILNDWSGKQTSCLSLLLFPSSSTPSLARDIQAFEMAPLGPLNGKNFGTSISPWVVTGDALEPFKTSGSTQTQPVHDYLKTPPTPTYDIRLEAEISVNGQSTVTCKSQLQTLYWTLPQAIANLSSAGGGLRVGDLVATGTVSGSEDGQHGCLLESTEGGTVPIVLKDGSQRRYLEDGDIVGMSAVAGNDDSGVGFGQCIGQLIRSARMGTSSS
jgi:fumarylacetoacetase